MNALASAPDPATFLRVATHSQRSRLIKGRISRFGMAGALRCIRLDGEK